MTDQPMQPDLKSLLAQATPPSSHCTVALNQGLRETIAELDAELTHAVQSGADDKTTKALARKIEATRKAMKASEVTFRFKSIDAETREAVRKAMQGRDEPDEFNLRAIAALCVEPAGIDWMDMRDLRKNLGVRVFEETIDAAATEASGGDWSVPFSWASSAILGTVT